MSLSCLFSLSTNDNIIIACKVVVVLGGSQHFRDFSLMFFFLSLAKIFQKSINRLYNLYRNPTM